jgi:hypothetical protein
MASGSIVATKVGGNHVGYPGRERLAGPKDPDALASRSTPAKDNFQEQICKEGRSCLRPVTDVMTSQYEVYLIRNW